MKTRIARYVLTAVGVVGLAGTPALFAGDRFDGDRFDRGNAYGRYDLHRDYNNLARQNEDIRSDRRRLRDDVEDGRYRQAYRDRADLNRDYNYRNRQTRDINHDRRDMDRDDYYREGWR